MHAAVNAVEFIQDWSGKYEERTGSDILISVLGGVSTIGKSVATVSNEPTSELVGVVKKQIAGKASGFFDVVNTYGNIGE